MDWLGKDSEFKYLFLQDMELFPLYAYPLLGQNFCSFY